jgi:hypothetical protein
MMERMEWKATGESFMSKPSPADCVGISRQGKCDYRIESGMVVASPRFMRIPSRDLGGETTA